VSAPGEVTESELYVSAGTSCRQAVVDAGLPTDGPAAIVVVKDEDGQLRDLSWTPEEAVRVRPVPLNSQGHVRH
jgi:threonyl-tRNA synthetase